MIKKIKEFYLKNIRLPSPSDLGVGRGNALPMRMITPFCKDYTWEDFDEEIKIRFPIRYFIWKVIPNLFKKRLYPLKRRIGDSFYWLKCHLFKNYKYHLIDIRQPKESSYPYRYGYIDACDKILLANFSILKDFVENGGVVNLLDTYSIEEIKNQGLMTQHEHYLETMELYRWWTSGRKEMLEKQDSLYDISKNEKDEKQYRIKFREWMEFEEEFNKVEDEMLIRLMKIRRGLWD